MTDFTTLINQQLINYSVSSVDNQFHFNVDDLIETAIREGYYVIYLPKVGDWLENITLSGERIKFHSLDNEKNGFVGFDRDKWKHDKYCWIGPGLFYNDEAFRIVPAVTSVSFFGRMFFKGRSTNRFTLHRENGPAIISSTGLCWMMNGKCHNDNDLPSKITNDVIEWCHEDKWHRENGPAKIHSNGNKEWFINHFCEKRFVDGRFEKFYGFVNRLPIWKECEDETR